MRILKLAAWLLVLVLYTSTAFARSNYAPGSLDAYFTVDWTVVQSVRGPVIEGFVYNRFGLGTDRMLLSIESLDPAGQIVSSRTTWVLGGVPPNNRTWFSTPVAAGAGYRVEILSFDWVGRGQ